MTESRIYKKIVFGDTELNIIDCYAFSFTNGKVVLRVSAYESEVTEADMKLLKTNTAVVDYYEQIVTTDTETGESTYGEWEKKMSYDGYTSGEYISNYQNGIYNAEVTRLGEIEKEVKQNTANIDYIALMADIDLF